MQVRTSIISRSEARAEGKTRYFTGERCKNGHVTERYVSSANCRTCLEARDSPEKKRARNSARYKASAGEMNANIRAWQIAHADEYAAMQSITEARGRGAVVPEGLGYRDFLPIYAEARRLTRETGTRYEVDHILPISRGGKHDPSNLQILSLSENRRKGVA